MLSLVDVFQKLISDSLKLYQLDLSFYFSFAGLSWDEMLKTTGIKLELISDIEKHLFIEKGLRGEIS